MKLRNLWMLLVTLVLSGSVTADEEGELKDIYGLEIATLYQLVDDEQAPIDFQAANVSHRCGGETSNHFRVYAEYPEVLQRKYQLLLSALNFNHKIALQPKGCEGKRMLVGWLRIAKR